MAADSDSDGVDDLLDNCVNIANGPLLTTPAGGASQIDSDNDGYGNRCDGDLDNNGYVNAWDYLIFKSHLGRVGNDIADISGNGYVNAFDTPLFIALMGLPVGPGSDPPCSAGGAWPTACAFHGDNAYDWDVFASYPDCTSSAGNILQIDESSDWNQINSSSYRIFCVHPGDYRGWSGSSGAVLNLTADGTSSAPRWIVLYDPAVPANRTHPALLDESDRAIMPQFSIRGGDHWQIVRMTVRGYKCDSSGACPGEVVGTTGTRFSHMLIEDGRKSAFPEVIHGNGDYIFQYNVHRNVEPDSLGQTDRVAFYFDECAAQPCVMVRNEIINPASDGVQVAGEKYAGGLRIDENEFYITDARRTNCAGVPDSSGACASNEVMIVFKDPRIEPVSASYVTNNVIHDSYDLDASSCCSQTVNVPAPAIIIGSDPHGPLTNVIIENNVIYHSSGGIVFRYDSNGNGAKFLQVRRNLLSDVRSMAGTETALSTWEGPGHIETRNVIVDADSFIGTSAYLGAYKTHHCNVAIDGGGINPEFPNSGGSWRDNYAYGNSKSASESVYKDTGYADAGVRADARHDSLCVVSSFITRPTRFCIADGKVTSLSPHVNCTP